MDEPNFAGIDAGIAELQRKLTALSPEQRNEGINRLRATFKRWGVRLDEADESALTSWAAGTITTSDLVSHMGPRLNELASRHEQH